MHIIHCPMITSLANIEESIEELLEKSQSVEQGGQLQNEYIKINSFCNIPKGIG